MENLIVKESSRSREEWIEIAGLPEGQVSDINLN